MQRLVYLLYSIIVCVVITPDTASAAAAEAREVARLNGCSPKKVEVYQQKINALPETIYRVECISPKVVDDKAPKLPNAVLVQCDGSLCGYLRALFETAP